MKSLMICLSLCFGLASAQVLSLTETPQAESYGLFSVNNSGINGNMQVSTDAGRVKIVVTVPNVQAGQRYSIALFQGDCGPDRVMVTELESLPGVDPYSSITYSDIPFDTITQGDHFAYVYAGEVNQANIVACGEVGLGANASATE